MDDAGKSPSEQDTGPILANSLIEAELTNRINGIAEQMNADVVSYVGPFHSGVDDVFRSMVEHLQAQETNRESLAVLLTTTGGALEVVRRICETIRHFYKDVTFLIPRHAYSAGTVLAMSGDRIYMDYYSRLGPIDPQIPNAEGTLIPATGYLKRYQELVKAASSRELNQAEILVLLDFDQGMLYAYDQAVRQSLTLIKDWLVRYKFKHWVQTDQSNRMVTDQMRKQRAGKVARALANTERWLSHGHGISRDVLTELGVQIEQLEADQRLYAQVRSYDELLSDFQTKLGARLAFQVAGGRPALF